MFFIYYLCIIFRTNAATFICKGFLIFISFYKIKFQLVIIEKIKLWELKFSQQLFGNLYSFYTIQKILFVLLPV